MHQTQQLQVCHYSQQFGIFSLSLLISWHLWWFSSVESISYIFSVKKHILSSFKKAQRLGSCKVVMLQVEEVNTFPAFTWVVELDLESKEEIRKRHQAIHCIIHQHNPMMRWEKQFSIYKNTEVSNQVPQTLQKCSQGATCNWGLLVAQYKLGERNGNTHCCMDVDALVSNEGSSRSWSKEKISHTDVSHTLQLQCEQHSATFKAWWAWWNKHWYKKLQDWFALLYRIVEYPELKRIHKDHQSPASKCDHRQDSYTSSKLV